MSYKRQLIHYDGADNAGVKRQHRELSLDCTNATSGCCTTSGNEQDSENTTFKISQSNVAQTICFGTLCEVQAKPTGSLNAGTSRESNTSHGLGTGASEFFLFDIYLQDDIHGFAIHNKNMFVMIDLITVKKLEILKEQAFVSTKVVVGTKDLSQLSFKKGKKPFEISVNIYGRESDARDIGQQLSKVGAFLQHPFYLEDSVEYLNPQFFDLEDGPRYMTHLVGIDESKVQEKTFSDAVEDALTCLDHEVLALAINEPDIILTDDLMTPLQDHQKAALSFIQCRENPEYCQRVGRELLFYTRIPSSIPTLALGTSEMEYYGFIPSMGTLDRLNRSP
ncbi:hypothetical protein FSPOR_10783 [Fusarium sporotrichioides]|uniref:Uncharacterized protein n=1 Tax=Fusarium sporotrichioides TaxID=5514 RepID=A0A395RJC4_FUSSP|nr:hypothetical protein FSPOR_10783 [Fusarium sporotrichioides]